VSTGAPRKPSGWLFGLGARVRKRGGADWEGRVVGFYSTSLAPEGYAVESRHHSGSTQIYPRAALIAGWDAGETESPNV